MKSQAVALLVGFLFGLGLALSGMTQPQKIIGFIDFFGAWDPTLIFVMISAIGVHFFAYRFIRHKNSPFFAPTFYLPGKKPIDQKLIGGSILFGIGWALAGYCPGPALTSLASAQSNVILFVVSMSMGMYLHAFLTGSREKK